MPSEGERLFLRWSSYVEAGLAASTRKETARGSYFIQTNNERALARLVAEERAAARLEQVEEIRAAVHAVAEKFDIEGSVDAEDLEIITNAILARIRSLPAPPQKTQEEPNAD